MVKMCDAFDLVWLDEQFTMTVKELLAAHPHITAADLGRLGDGMPLSTIASRLSTDSHILPLYLRDGRLVGCMHAAHDEDRSLAADVLLENLVCKATATMAFRTLLAQTGTDPQTIEYVLNSGEEAVGDRYQRGGGNLAKAVAEMCGCALATGSDVKGFCCGPVHALALAGGLISSRMFRQVAVVGGCSLAKLGMKFQGHLQHDQPILEDVLAGVAIVVGEDDGQSPVMRLESIGRHTVGAGSSQQAIFEHLVAKPLQQLGLRFRDVDKYATELHNPEVTEPAGSGNVPLLNYRVIASLAALRKEITPAEIASFVNAHGMPGFSPTQGHIASAIPFLGHAFDRLTAGTMRRAMFLAKGSLFLGRMTQMADGLSFMLESQGR
jgi:betaine reductase